MNVEQPSSEKIIAGYLDMLLVDSNVWDENRAWDERLSQAVNSPIFPQDTIAAGRYLLTTETLGSGHKTVKYIHLLNGLSILNKLPVSKLKTVIAQRCLSLASEAMCFE
ncbi:MAG: hypothetical protein ACJAW8_002189 [Oleispira sp.]|jgi:hypothetical protein